jgi:hypothetical protein
MRRVNFAARILGDTSIPGVRAIIRRVLKQGLVQGSLSAQSVVAACLDALGPLEVSEETHAELIVHAERDGELAWSTNEELRATVAKISKILTLVAASREYQFA